MSGRTAAFFYLLLFVAGAARAESPRVVTSIKPLQSLAAGVMDGVGKPDVLIKGGASPHAYALRPSEAAALASADVIFWIGSPFEAFLQKPLESLGKKSTVVALMDVPGMKLLFLRQAGLRNRTAVASGPRDGHLWLDPANARVIAAMMAEMLSAKDPANAARYRENAATLDAKLVALDGELGAGVEPVKTRPFVAYHDAYQYFEARFGLTSVGAVTNSPERPPGGRHLTDLREKIAGLGEVCVFSEPQFEPKLVELLARDTKVRTGVLDPEGSTLEPGPELYFNLMRSLADNFIRCLSTP